MYYERTGTGTVVQADDTAEVGRILIVDDDPLFGAFAVAALESKGHVVDWTACGQDALAVLYASRYDLVIADLRLPDSSGLELLRKAGDAGLLTGTASIILTGHDFEEPCDIRVFHKPLDRDLDPLLDRIGHIISLAKRRRVAGKSGAESKATSQDAQRPLKRVRIELVLYTSASSEKCQRALNTVRRVLRDYDAGQVQFTVRDLAGDPDAGDEDAVVFTPTLVKRGPNSRTYIVGNLDEPQIVADLLDVSGVRRLRDDR